MIVKPLWTSGKVNINIPGVEKMAYKSEGFGRKKLSIYNLQKIIEEGNKISFYVICIVKLKLRREIKILTLMSFYLPLVYTYISDMGLNMKSHLQYPDVMQGCLIFFFSEF